MTRAAVALLLAAVLPAAAQDAKKPDYSPLAKGHRWDYRLTAGGQTLDAAAEITDVTTRDGKRVAKAEVRVAGTTLTEENAADDKGLYLLAYHGKRLTPHRTVLRLPATTGDTWTEKYKDGEDDAEATSKVRAAEAVTVPAGMFTAVPVETVTQTKGQKATSTTWYADGVGVVKLTATA
ncbi:MAG: hypothetical protein K2P78_14360 [Gemmataceae bacterium]|nr:hypothetical protein [Gemmataceae bacterium]